MPFAAIENTKLVGGWISHCFDECVFIYTSFSCFYIVRQILGFVNVSDWTRTSDRLLRRQLLYPTELLRHESIIGQRKGVVNPPIESDFYLNQS